MSSRRSFSESGLPEWLTSEEDNENELKSVFSVSDKEGSIRKNVKTFVRRCKSDPERGRKNQRESETVLIPTSDHEEALNRQAITDQPRKLSYFSYLGNTAARFGRYHSVSTNTDVGHVMFLENDALYSTCVDVSEMPRGKGPSFEKNMRARQYLNYLSCICCVKALLYHGTKDRELDRDWSDEPCTCEGPGKECLARWSILGILTVFMPCLLCYPVCKGC